MRKIDPKELLDCLDSLLGKKGGIKGESEVKRMADLMTKFSKKLVSKCIYIQILKNTDPDLLIKFMAEGGWALVFQWLDESIGNNNSALIREILELLLVCPISLDRLKENNCPKVVKGLSKDSEVEEVKRLACKLVEKWLKFIKSGQAAISDVAMAAASAGAFPKATISVSSSKVSSVPQNVTNNIRKVTGVPGKISKSDIQLVRKESSGDDGDEDDEIGDEEEEEEENEEVDEDQDDEVPPIGSLPLYKITVRDGKSVLAKVGTKTLTLPISKKTESETDSNSVTSLILKSDPISKKFRYVKAVSNKDKPSAGEVGDKSEKFEDKLRTSFSVVLQKLEGSDKKFRYVKEKSSGSESFAGELAGREKCEAKAEDKSRTSPSILQRLEGTDSGDTKSSSECDSLETVKNKNCDSVLKSVGSKSSRNEKVRDGQMKSSKIHKDRESLKSDSKHKVKEKRDSEKDRKRSEHKNHSSDKMKSSRDRDKDSDRSKSKDSSRDRHKDSDRGKPREKDSKSKDGKDSKTAEKPLTAAEKAQIQADKDKDTLERLKTPAINVLGKIPKKSSSLPCPTSAPPADASSKGVLPKPVESPMPGDKVSRVSGDVKKSVELRTPKDRPKTVKTFHSKFRSTGLEEEIKPPPSRSSIKKKIEEKRPAVKPDKYSSVPVREDQPPEKKSKVSDILADIKKDKIIDKPGAIKLIPPKPKPALLESDMFSDALTASTKFEPRKRKRRVSNGKDGPEPKKEGKDDSSPQEVTSPKEVKPALKFYRDTLEDEDEKNKENTSDGKVEPKNESDSEDNSKTQSSADEPSSKLYPNGVLVYKAKRGPKKSVKWKEESELTTIKFFELDENERVNVTRNFVDMKLMERSHEREAFQLARKLASDDIMEEKIPWGPLYEVDIPPDRRISVEPGKASQEKSVQFAREKTVLQAIYFHRNAIPDSPAEPDVEIHPTTDPKIIPLEDVTGNNDTVANFQNIPWPEPKPALIPSSPPPQQQLQHPMQPQQPQQPQGFAPGYSTVGNFGGYPAVGMPGMMPPGQGNWRTGDGKDMGMNMNFQPNGPMNMPQMNQPPNMFNPPRPDNFNMNGPPMGNFGGGFPMNCDPSMFGPPNMNMGGPPPPPPQWNRNWQGGGGGRGGGGGGGGGGGHFMPMNMSSKFQKGVCHHFAKFGNCSRGNSCRFMHPN